MVELAVYAFVTFFVTIGPIDLVPFFIALSAGADAVARRRIATWGTLVAGAVLVAFALGGEYLLSALGIGLPAFRIAGGILLLLLAVDMVFARHTGLSGMTPNEDEEARRREDVSIFPLAVPLIAGPGAMASAVLVMGQAQGNLAGQVTVLVMLALVLGLTLLSLLAAGPIIRLFGVTGVSVITRIAGIVLAALAAQYMLDGLRDSELLRALGHAGS